MKKHIYFISALVFFSFMSLVYPLHYHFFSEPVKELPEFTTYKQAVTEILPQKIYEKAGEYKCGDYIIPVSDVEGLPQSLEFVPDDINLAVQTFSGWKLLVDEDLKNKMKKRVEQRISVWGNMGIGREIGNILKTQKNAAMNTRYSIDAKCFELKDKKTDNIKLIVSVNDEISQAKLFDIPVLFTHDKIINQLKEQRNLKLSQYNTLKKRAEISLYALYGAGFVFIAYLLSFVALGGYRAKIIKDKKSWLLNEIEKREELINDGHFVTALELADKYLKYFPESTEIKAFRQRLLDYTGNDPKKAQAAFVEWKKIQMRLNNNSGVYLTEEEKNKIKGLVEYYPELKTSYLQLEYLGEQKKSEMEKEIHLKYLEITEKIKNKDLNSAKNILNQILNNEYVPEYIKDFSKRLDFNPLKSFKLKSASLNIELLVFNKDKISFGRGDEKFIPDILINDRRISRNQAEIEVYLDKIVLKDNESTGGTFVNGEKTDVCELKNNDVLNFSKILEFDVSIGESSDCGSLYLDNTEIKAVVIKDSASFNISEKGIRFNGTDFEILKIEGITFLFSGENIFIPKFNDEITINGNPFKIGEI